MKLIVLLLVLGIITIRLVDSQACTHGDVRLIWGDGNWEGNVQICINGTWGWVCDNWWGTADAQVVCKQLGFSATGARYRTWSYYGWANLSVPIYLDYMSCAGTETKLINCPHNNPIGVTNCGYNEIAGVVCPSGGTCTTGSIRKIRNSDGTPYRDQGRIEVCYNSQWGTVCDDYWSSVDARVACYQLGYYTKSSASSYCCASFGQGYGNIWFDNVGCSGSENSLFSCNKNSIGSHNCGHHEDAGVRCYGQVTGSCTNGDVMLWRPGDGPEYFGLALYCKNNAWTGVCDDSWTCHTARLFCQQLGYIGAMATRGRNYWGYYYGIDHYAWYCSSTHTSLSQCFYYYHSNCNSYFDQLGIICYPNLQGTSCTNGAVRMVNGNTPFEGRAEYCFEGEWVPLCGLSAATASTICQQLGFETNYAIVYNDERFGINDVRSGLNYLNCPSDASSLSQCTEVRKGSSNGCFKYINKCGTEYGLRCFNMTGCPEGKARLVGGSFDQEGRVEVCSDGVWISICQSGWNAIDAYVLCNQLGYAGINPKTYYNAYYGVGNGPSTWSGMNCFGWEKSVSECSKNVYPTGSCSSSTTVGVVCKQGCTYGDVRLIGGAFENEGTVQVCYNKLWGLISDYNWDNNDAKVVCNQLGYTAGNALAILGSQYGKPNITVHLKNVNCTGNENTITQCTKTQLSINDGRLELPNANAAGVDCIYDEPVCVERPATYNNPGSECNNTGNIRLQGSSGQTDRGRLEYCYNGYWSPFCKLDPVAASVACRQLGFSLYTWAAIFESNEFGVSKNYSLFDNITCTGSETSISQCNVNVNPSCTPWCRLSNLGIRCFNPGNCTNGDVRLADGFIDNEGRVEVCVNRVWGAVCDQGWDKTDAHVVCTQLGHPELEPIVLQKSEFGAGQYPIVYTNTGCGGWESQLNNCNKQVYPLSSCSRNNVAGILCGYDCNNGDIRLTGSQWKYEGTVQICLNNIWGLIADSGWHQHDAEVLCLQLGYQAEGSQAQYGSQYGKPNLPIFISDAECEGTEDNLLNCTLTELSLQAGKDMLSQTDVAGVKCYTPDQCVTPLTGGDQCTDGEIRLTGGQFGLAEGTLQYCYSGYWSPFCYLGPNEATVACRQLGYSDYDLTVVFTDGRFSNMTNVTSQLQNISCSNNLAATTLIDCDIMDQCQSRCENPIGLRCYRSTNCQDGDVRLVDGDFVTEGRLEVCTNGIWGTVCGTGFNAIDAYVVCKELGLGLSEPVFNTNSFFGDGDTTISLSEVNCGGFEASIIECSSKKYGDFTCSTNNVVGIICQENCNDGQIRLTGGTSNMEGTVEVCYYSTWGLIADADWGNHDAQVACKQLGYNEGGDAITGSVYGKPNRTIQLSNVACDGSEASLDACDNTILTPEEGRDLFLRVSVAGVKCFSNVTTDASSQTMNKKDYNFIIGLGVVGFLLTISILVTLSLILYVAFKHQQVKKAQAFIHEPRVQMSALGGGRGTENPLYSVNDEEGGEVIYNTADKDELVKRLGSM